MDKPKAKRKRESYIKHSDEKRRAIIQALESGMPAKNVSKLFDAKYDTVRSIFRVWKVEGRFVKKLRGGKTKCDNVQVGIDLRTNVENIGLKELLTGKYDNSSLKKEPIRCAIPLSTEESSQSCSQTSSSLDPDQPQEPILLDMSCVSDSEEDTEYAETIDSQSDIEEKEEMESSGKEEKTEEEAQEDKEEEEDLSNIPLPLQLSDMMARSEILLYFHRMLLSESILN